MLESQVLYQLGHMCFVVQNSNGMLLCFFNPLQSVNWTPRELVVINLKLADNGFMVLSSWSVNVDSSRRVIGQGRQRRRDKGASTLWNKWAPSKNFCSFGGELRDFLIEQSYWSSCVVWREARWWRTMIASRLKPFLKSLIEKLEIFTNFFSATSLKKSVLRFLHRPLQKNPWRKFWISIHHWAPSLPPP